MTVCLWCGKQVGGTSVPFGSACPHCKKHPLILKELEEHE